MREKVFLCIDLKSFFASVECVERNLDPFTTNLVVADPERTNKTICLAITPAMKKLGIKNRCRVFQIPQNVDYIMATPRMQLYIDYSAKIYGIYLKFISKEDIHVYSIDEAFFDITEYLHMYNLTPVELAKKMTDEIYKNTGITATCGIGSNLYLAKIALDIIAKNVDLHIGILDERKYIQTLWNYKPLTDFWRIGRGISSRLSHIGILTMKDIAMAQPDILYKMFGVDAELLIDHAWGRETTTISDIKNYKSEKNSISSGQVLARDYSFQDAEVIVKEMSDIISLQLVDKRLVTDSVTLIVGYSSGYKKNYERSTVNLGFYTSSTRIIIDAVKNLYNNVADRYIPIRCIHIVCNNVKNEICIQYNFFVSQDELDRERKLQEGLLKIKKKYGNNSILKGMDLLEVSTTRERNVQIGGHKSGV